MKQKWTSLKGEIDNSTVTVGKFNISLSTVDRTTRQKINKAVDLSNTINQLNP